MLRNAVVPDSHSLWRLSASRAVSVPCSPRSASSVTPVPFVPRPSPQAVEDYCRQRSLPHTLTQKLVEYFQFQQRKKRVTDMQARAPFRRR